MARNLETSLGIAQVQDQTVRRILKVLIEQVQEIRGTPERSGVIRGNLRLQGGRIISLGDPGDSEDAVSKGYADAVYGSAATRKALQAGGTAPLNVGGLIGVLGQVQPARLRVIPQNAALPPVATGQDYELIRYHNGVSWALYFFDPTTPPGSWVAV